MRIIVGLGNPGPGYAVTRHNAGFLLADVLADQWRLSPFRRSGPATVAEGRHSDHDVLVVKPQTYMNRSGRALRALIGGDEIDLQHDLLILVDDFALAFGSFRLRARGSAGGHNGLESVEAALQTREYARLRLGVGPVPEGVDPADFVLEPFETRELDQLVDLLPELHDAVACWVDEGIETAMNRYNRRGMQRD